MNKYINKIYQSRVLSALVFFGLAGAIWGGWDLYGVGIPPADYPLTIIGAILLGVLGGLGLALPTTRSAAKIGKIVVLGLVGSVLGFIVAWLGIYGLLIVGTYILAVFPVDISDSIRLEPDLKVAAYWLNFTLAGSFIGLFWGIGLRKKILYMTLRGAVGFGLAAIVGPIIGNLVGDLFNSLLVSYIITFVVIGAALGVSLTLQFSKKEKEGSTAQ